MKVANLTVNLDARQLDEIMQELGNLRRRISVLEGVNAARPVEGDVVQWRSSTMPYGMWRRGVAERWDYERELWLVRDEEGFHVTVHPGDENILRAKA